MSQAPAPATGQDRARAQIRAWFTSQRLPHAILVTGREGVGKRRLTLDLARACTCRVEPGVGCGACASCRKVTSLTHPNVHVLLPLPTGTSRTGTDAEQFSALRETALDYLSGGASGRAGGNIPKDHVLLLQREMSFAPTEAPRRVALIFEADCMQAAGANSLLKTLEEPPAHAIFVLVSTTTDRLLPTVVSRCQRLPLQPLTATQVREQAVTDGVPEARAELAARLATASPVPAAQVVGDDFDDLRELVERFIDSGISGSDDDYWELLEALGGRPDKQRLQSFFGLCSAYLRDLLLIHLRREPAIANHDRQPRLAAWAARLDDRGLDAVARALDGAYESQSRNVHPQLLLADLWNQLRRSASASV